MSCTSCNSRDMQNKNTPNLMFAQSSSFDDNTSIHANYTQFEQVSDRQFTALLMEVGKINSQIQVNNRNLIQMGRDMTKMGNDAVWFGNEITKFGVHAKMGWALVHDENEYTLTKTPWSQIY